MKFIISALLVLSLISITWSSTSIGLYANPKYPGKCYFSKDEILSPGEYKDPKSDCGRVLCFHDGSAHFHDCGTQQIYIEGFTLGDYEDKTLPYPKCCKRKIVPIEASK